MYRPVRNLFIMTIVALLFFAAGCTKQQEPPTVRRSRAIAAENIELKKDINRRDKEIEDLKAQQEKEIKELRKELQKCIEQRDAWKTKAERNIRNQVKSVLDTVLEENAMLREENENLKKQIAQLRN